MPLLASAAVMLSVAMELITWSVMGGFLEQLIQSGRTLMGDVEITRPQRGFPHYEELMAALEADEWVVAASPTIDAFGLIKLVDQHGDRMVRGGQIKGIDPESLDRVTGFYDTLYWVPLDEPLPRDSERKDPRLDPEKRETFEMLEDLGRNLYGIDVDTQSDRPQAVLGIEVFGKRGLRDPAGFVTDQFVFLPGFDVTLNVLPIDTSGGFLEPVARKLQIGNEFSSNIYEIDSQTIYVPLAFLQDMLKMDEAERVEQTGPIEFIYDEDGNPIGTRRPESVGVVPARVTSLLVRGGDDVPLEDLRARVEQVYHEFTQTKYVPLEDLRACVEQVYQKIAQTDGVSLEDLRAQVEQIYYEFTQTKYVPLKELRAHIEQVYAESAQSLDSVPLEDLRARIEQVYQQFAQAPDDMPSVGLIEILTWEDRNATLIGAIKKETGLVLFIFGIISLTSVFLVLAIFWSMISERTKDIGILRALGASGPGVAWLWVRYGLIIGVVGSILGVGLAYLVITNINAIHNWLGQAFGIAIWDPSVYYFSEIPEDFSPMKAVIIGLAGIVSCGLGALIPAWRAARMDPVKALRFE